MNNAVPMRADSGASANHPLQNNLQKSIRGDVLFDDFSRARYATDASIYQIRPLGVVVPRDHADVVATLAIAREYDVPVLPRGGGTSQCGQTVAHALVIDTSKYLNQIVTPPGPDDDAPRVRVQPGIVLDQLNQQLKQHGLFFPIDPSTASRATIGGMVGNNSCGARSIRYGNTVHNVAAIDAVLANGEEHRFSHVSADLHEIESSPALKQIVEKLRYLVDREKDEIATHWPRVLRHVGGYNLTSINPDGHNLAQILVGSEGTLAYFREIELQLQPIPRHRVLGVCRFARFYDAMAKTQDLVELNPAAVELVDRTMIELAMQIDEFRPVMQRITDANTDALLLVEFAGDDLDTQLRSLDRLETMMADLGFVGATLKVADTAEQSAIWNVRKSGLNIMMSMKGDRKPVSFIEDCAVPLEHLAEYTDRLNGIFARHGTKGTFYAHASVGCLHVRPILNMKSADDVRTMRAIAEETFALVKEYKGSHSGEHGDGIVRSEFLEPMLGSRITRTLEEIKDLFDPDSRFNPGRIVRAPKMDDRSLFRFTPDYSPQTITTALDWSDWGGLSGAVEMCNNNGACRKNTGVMCPSFKISGEEKHLTRGRANTLRQAISGQLGRDALTSDAMKETMDLCVGCKGCKRECPTGVDMARMKIEFMHHFRQRHKPRLRERLVAWLPRYAARAQYFSGLLNSVNKLPVLRSLNERLLGFSRHRSMPKWQTSFIRRYGKQSIAQSTNSAQPQGERRVGLFVDTFTNSFEPDIAQSALDVLAHLGYDVTVIGADLSRPLCCGRTFLTGGFVQQAEQEVSRLLDAFDPLLQEGIPVVGIEPSCILGMRDELPVFGTDDRRKELANGTYLIEEFLCREMDAGRINASFTTAKSSKVMLHGHCHQKAMGVVSDVQRALGLIPGLTCELIESSCCGMAGAFGFEAEHYEQSMAMANLDLLPAVRATAIDTPIVADGTSCRHQIHDGSERHAQHVVQLLAEHIPQKESDT